MLLDLAHKLCQGLICAQQILRPEFLGSGQFLPQPNETARMTGELAHAARMCEAAVEESLFPFEHAGHIRLPRARHIAFADISPRSFGVPVRSDQQRRVGEWPL